MENKRISKKTARLIVENLNDILAMDKIPQDCKMHICCRIENILHEAKAYRGYNNLKWLSNNGYMQWVKDGKPEDTRKYHGLEYDRFYYL